MFPAPVLAFDTPRVARLVARARTEDRGELRLALEALLDRTDFDLPDLPPRAILIVRRLQGALRRRRPDPGVASLGQTEIRGRLEALAAAACRPAENSGDADAEAVLFRNPAELIACLAHDIASGTAGRRWYWRVPLALLLRPTPGATIAALLDEVVLELPEVIAVLAETKVVDRVLATLTPDAAQGLAVRLATAHGLFDLARDLERPPAVWSVLPRGVATGLAPEALLPTPAHALLLTLATQLHHRPGALRAPEAVRALVAWWCGVPPLSGAAAEPLPTPARPGRVDHRVHGPRAQRRTGLALSPEAANTS